MEKRIYSRLDSATAVLRKLGVAREDYKYFIVKIGGDKFELEYEKACEDVKRRNEEEAEEAEALGDKNASPKVRHLKKVDGVGRSGSVAATIRKLVLEGLSNTDIVAKLDLPANKQHYPAWYRAEMRRKGQLS